MERMVQAAEDLLEQRPFEAFTVAEIVQRAGTSVGAFYARFSSKRDLLAAIYARRFGTEATARSMEYLTQFAARQMPLEHRAYEIVHNMVAYYGRNRRLLKEMVSGLELPESETSAWYREVRAHETAFHDGWAKALLSQPDQIGHEDPERSVRFALSVAAAACRDAILLGGEPRAEDLRTGDLARELTRLLCAYLRGPAGGSAAVEARDPLDPGSGRFPDVDRGQHPAQ